MIAEAPTYPPACARLVGERPSDLELMLAKAEATRECRHCWHAVNDAAADNHDASCCRCHRASVPTVKP